MPQVRQSGASTLVPVIFLAVQLTSYVLWRRLNGHHSRRRRYLLGERTRELAAEGHA